MRWIAQNTGFDGSIVVEKVKNEKGGFGFNAQTEKYEDLIAAGIIDPTKVVRCAIQNASSVASLLLTTEAMIAEKPKKESAHARNAPRRNGRHGWNGLLRDRRSIASITKQQKALGFLPRAFCIKWLEIVNRNSCLWFVLAEKSHCITPARPPDYLLKRSIWYCPLP